MKDPQSFAGSWCDFLVRWDISTADVDCDLAVRVQVGQIEGVRSTAHRRRTQVRIQIKRGAESFCLGQKEFEFARNAESFENAARMEGRSSINEMACDGDQTCSFG